ncbi:NAD(P)-dependent oxidoreductase [Erythrobacteraceae bacterium WH01K]|nr:NAD(P)-dependent oxidoreductase [Erythrobacteraceae bacterium WH01K]
MTIAITGGTGFVGQALIDLAERRKVALRSLARSVPKDRRGVDWVEGDLGNRDALRRLLAQAEAVIHIAGQVRATDPAEFEQANVTGTLNVVEAAIDTGVSRFVFVSSLAAREPQLSAYGASKLRAERIVKASGLDWTIVRPPAIYGPRDREMLDLFEMARLRVVPMPKRGSASIIHVGDLVRLLLELHEGGEGVTSQMFEPDDGRPGGWEHRALAKAIGAAVGTNPLVPRLPAPVMRFAAWMDSLLRRGDAKLTPDRVGYMMHPDWVSDPARRPPEALWRPVIPTPEGLAATALWYRRNEWL